MKANLILIPVIAFALSACKKKDPQSAEPAPVVETSCTCSKDVIGVTMPENTPSYGFLSVTSTTNNSLAQPYSSIRSYATFHKIAQVEASNYDTLKVDSLLCNNIPLYSFKDNFGKTMCYFRDTYTLSDPLTWRVFSTTEVPSFEYTPLIKMPSANFSNLPSSISKALVKSFSINDAANFTRGSVFLANSQQSGPNITLILKPGNNTVCFPSDLLQNIVNGMATLIIELENTETTSFGGKPYTFSKKTVFIKTIDLRD